MHGHHVIGTLTMYGRQMLLLDMWVAPDDQVWVVQPDMAVALSCWQCSGRPCGIGGHWQELTDRIDDGNPW